MYGWIWRHLPGPVVVRLLLVLIAIAGIVAVLFLVVFPAVEPLLPLNDSTLDEAS
ncbi:MAG: hypothetical protein ACK5H2_01460 [Beutenbergiaceae bacterium]